MKEVVNKGIIAGRLARFLDNWSKLSQDQWIFDTIQGVRIEFLEEPIQTKCPRVGVSSSQEQSLINEDIKKMISKGVITELPQ